MHTLIAPLLRGGRPDTARHARHERQGLLGQYRACIAGRFECGDALAQYESNALIPQQFGHAVRGKRRGHCGCFGEIAFLSAYPATGIRIGERAESMLHEPLDDLVRVSRKAVFRPCRTAGKQRCKRRPPCRVHHALMCCNGVLEEVDMAPKRGKYMLTRLVLHAALNQTEGGYASAQGHCRQDDGPDVGDAIGIRHLACP